MLTIKMVYDILIYIVLIWRDKMKKLFTIILICFTTITLVGCGNKEIKKAIADGNSAFESRQYEQALTSYKYAIDKGSKDEEVKLLVTIISTYLDGEKAFSEEEFEKAKDILNNLDKDFSQYIIKEDIEKLYDKIDKKIKEKDNDEKLSNLDEAIENKKIEEAKTMIKELEKEDLNDSQRKKLTECIDKINQMEEKIKQDNIQQNTESSTTNNNNNTTNTDNVVNVEVPDNNKSNEEIIGDGVINAEKAVELTKKYIYDNGEYMSSIVEVDNETETDYVVHSYDIIDNGDGTSHTATSGWYYVNKSSGVVSSMF